MKEDYVVGETLQWLGCSCFCSMWTLTVEKKSCSEHEIPQWVGSCSEVDPVVEGFYGVWNLAVNTRSCTVGILQWISCNG